MEQNPAEIPHTFPTWREIVRLNLIMAAYGLFFYVTIVGGYHYIQWLSRIVEGL